MAKMGTYQILANCKRINLLCDRILAEAEKDPKNTVLIYDYSAEIANYIRVMLVMGGKLGKEAADTMAKKYHRLRQQIGQPLE